MTPEELEALKAKLFKMGYDMRKNGQRKEVRELIVKHELHAGWLQAGADQALLEIMEEQKQREASGKAMQENIDEILSRKKNNSHTL